MARRQEILLQKSREAITDLRNLLDDLMYNAADPIDDKSFTRIREAYDLICQANDKL